MNAFGNALVNAATFMRGQYAGAFNETATIKTQGTAENATGSTLPTYTGSTELPCRLEAADANGMNEQERIIAEKWQAKAIYRIDFEHGAAVVVGQHAVIGGRTFNIVSASKGEGTSVCLSCLGVELPNGA